MDYGHSCACYKYGYLFFFFVFEQSTGRYVIPKYCCRPAPIVYLNKITKTLLGLYEGAIPPSYTRPYKTLTYT